MKKTMKWVLIICGILFILGAGGCVALLAGTGAVVDTTVKEIETQKAEEDNALVDMLNAAKITEQEDGLGGFDVLVSMQNTTDRDFDYIEIEYSVYDTNGTKIGGSYTSITDIKAGQSFQMKFNVYEDGAQTYEIDNITGTLF